jgi:hypothetical protein
VCDHDYYRLHWRVAVRTHPRGARLQVLVRERPGGQNQEQPPLSRKGLAKAALGRRQGLGKQNRPDYTPICA